MGIIRAIFGPLLSVKRQNTLSTYATYAAPRVKPGWPAESASAGSARVAGVLSLNSRGSGGRAPRAGRQPPSAAAGRPGKAGSSNAGRTYAWVGCAGWGRTPAVLAPAAGSARTVRQIGAGGLWSRDHNAARPPARSRAAAVGPGPRGDVDVAAARRPPSPARRGRPCSDLRPACGSAPAPGPGRR